MDDMRPQYPDGSPMTPEDDAKDMQPYNDDGTLKDIMRVSKTSSRVFSKDVDPELAAKTMDPVQKHATPNDEAGWADWLDLVDRDT